MNYLFQRRVVYTLGLMLALCMAAAPTFAQKKGNRAKDARRHSADAAEVFNEIMTASDNAIPKELVIRQRLSPCFPGS